MTGPRIGSLFSGYGGLDMGVQAVLGGEVAWHVEYDKAPSQILEHHWPNVPNFGDITSVDWSSVEPVDIITGGFPCQDLSLAGRRAGMREGTRSGLWSDYLRAIDVLRPKLALIENVRGLLSGCAESDLEPCPGCLGDGEHRPVLRALGRVLGDLAFIGYDTQWLGLRAADAGAPHGRFRVFVLAWPSDSANHGQPVSGSRGSEERFGAAPRDWDAAAYASCHEPERRRVDRDMGSATHADEGKGEERQWVRNPLSDRGSTLADADSGRPQERLWDGTDPEFPVPSEYRSDTTRWGDYAEAVERWEQILGRNAPDATEPGDGGRQRLSPPFVEWMMGLPIGHVTQSGIPRSAQLKALGNGVVPQQAALALSILLGSLPHSNQPTKGES